MKKNERTVKEQIHHLERSIAKFGDSDGTRFAALERLRSTAEYKRVEILRGEVDELETSIKTRRRPKG